MSAPLAEVGLRYLDSNFWGSWPNVNSGLLGAILGAVVGGSITLLVLFITLAVQRRESEKMLAAQQANFERSLESSDEHARKAREIDAVSSILSFLQVEFESEPMNLEKLPELSSLCASLWLNASQVAADGWRDRMDAVRNGRKLLATRHPLSSAIYVRVAAILFAMNFPRTAIYRVEPSEARPLELFLITESSIPELLSEVAGVSRKMLGWSRMSESEKASLFDDMLAKSVWHADGVLTAANLLIGGSFDDELLSELPFDSFLTPVLQVLIELGSPAGILTGDRQLEMLERVVETDTLPILPSRDHRVRFRPIRHGEYLAAEFYKLADEAGERAIDERAVDRSHVGRLFSRLEKVEAEQDREAKDRERIDGEERLIAMIFGGDEDEEPEDWGDDDDDDEDRVDDDDPLRRTAN